MDIEILRVAIGIIVLLISSIWTTTLWQIKRDIRDIKTGLTKHDDRIDDMERFSERVKTTYNIDHPDHKINGLH